MTSHFVTRKTSTTGQPPLVLVHSLGLGPALWGGLRPLIESRFDLVEATLPGHSNTAPVTTAFTINDLAHEISELATAEGWTSYGYLGVSIGGAVGLELSRRDPRVAGVICVSVAASFGNLEMWMDRAQAARENGPASFAEMSRGRWFSPAYLERHGEAAEALVAFLGQCDANSYAAACEAIGAFDFTAHRGNTGQPILVLNGSEDVLVTPESGHALTDIVDNARADTVHGVAHLGPIEKPDVYAAALESFLRPRLI